MCRSLAAMFLMAIAIPASAASREEEAKKYANDLKSKDAKVRLSALKELEKLGAAAKKYVEPYLSEIANAMKDSDAAVRGEAASALASSDPPNRKEVVAKIATALLAESSEVARAGMETALGKLGGMPDADADTKKAAREGLMEARKKYVEGKEAKREQKVIQAALLAITGMKKKN